LNRKNIQIRVNQTATTPYDIFKKEVWLQVGIISELKICEMQEEISINGIWTHLFRNSRTKQKLADDTSIELVKLQLKHLMNDAT